MSNGAESKPVALTIPFTTFLEIFVAILIGYSLYLLWEFVFILFLSVLVAVTLYPVVLFLMRHRWPKWLAITAISTILVVVLLGGVSLLAPAVKSQLDGLSQRMPEVKEKLVSQAPTFGGIQESVKRFLDHPPKAGKWLEHVMAIGQSAIGGIAWFLLLLVLSIYLLIDGEKTYEWFLAFLSEENQAKAKQTTDEISKVIFAYVSGQFITSAFATVYTFTALTLLHVPAAIVLALLAGVFDVLPVVGFFLSLIPALCLALTVSPGTALIIIGLYLLYHGIENYIIVPKVYGKRLDVSGLVVLITLIVASTVAGVLGAIAILPIVASYPIVERIWLGRYVGRNTVRLHNS